MGYALQGVLGRSSVLEPCRLFEHARVVALDQSVCLLLMTDDFFNEVRQEGAEPGVPGFWKLPTGFDRVLATWSVRGPVAYVEADYFGGVGSQVAAVWDAGQLVLGPTAEPEHSFTPEHPSPISQALQRLGVSARGHFDEFEAVGLDRHRNMEDWLEDVQL